ncbi:MAG: 7-cyano-7-deazaguanine synthase [Waltera sp.]
MKALVLLSGGMDSTVTLAMAKQECNRGIYSKF